MADALPLIDVSALAPGADDGSVTAVARQIDDACRRVGFFRITGHGIPSARLDELAGLARRFFAEPDDTKAAIAMAHAGAAWRGWFPLDGELTSGRPDHKEGLYFGTELGADHPAVVAGRPLHGANLFPASVPELRPSVLEWIAAMTALGAALLEAVAIGLGLDRGWFARHVTADPTVLFRIFRYPPDRSLRSPATQAATGHSLAGARSLAPETYVQWGVAEHTDYGLLTILATDDHGGLQVHAPTGWIDVPADPGVFVVNLGDMLERMTAGRYRSTPHRVRNTSGAERLSFPCFIDPSWDAVCPVLPLAGSPPPDDPTRRWDGRSVLAWDGTYGEYLTAKVARVFPALVPATARSSDAR